ncbi:MAG: hypothetical protein IJU45_05115 [Clostridia bacterium]|nr:hypothetical protein [Clostridia bacterium]
MDIRNLAAWDRFAQSGKVEDYLQYKHISRENEKDAAEYGRTDNKGTQDERR